MLRNCWKITAALILLTVPAHASCDSFLVKRNVDALVECALKNSQEIEALTVAIDQLNRDIDLINRRFEGQARTQELRDKYNLGKLAIKMACQNRAEIDAIHQELKLVQPTETRVGNCLSE